MKIYRPAWLIAILILSLAVLTAGCGGSTSPITTSGTTPVSSATATATPTPTPSSTTPTVSETSPAPTADPTPTTIYVPDAEPYIPEGEQLELFNYVLELINQDRADHQLPPVELAYNAAAQKHAQDMLDNKYLAHWGTDGLKPYMRYTFEGGLNYEGENSAYSENSQGLNTQDELRALEYMMMYDDASANWSHRDNILNQWHQKVNLGIAYSSTVVALVQQFEGDYVEYYQPPAINGNIFSVSGRFKTDGLVLNNVAVTYDPLPVPLTGAELKNGPYHSYGFGQILGQVFPPPPPGSSYTNLPANSVVAEKGKVDDAYFQIEANISTLLAQGPGVYTLVLVATGENRNFSNYSIVIN